MEMQELEKNIQAKEVLCLMASNLTIRECDVIIGRYVHDMTYREIGEYYEVCPQRIMQILRKAMRKLHKVMNTNPPIDLKFFSYMTYEESAGLVEVQPLYGE